MTAHEDLRRQWKESVASDREIRIPRDEPRYVVRVTRWDGMPPSKAAVELQVQPWQSRYRKSKRPTPPPATFTIGPDDARELARAFIAVADAAENDEGPAD